MKISEKNIKGTSITFLEFVPVSLFGGILGLTGLTLSWRLAEAKWGFNLGLGNCLGVITILLFFVLLITYLGKLFYYPSSVINEFNHPVSISFFTTFIVCFLLLPGIIFPYHEKIAFCIWLTGVFLIFVFTLFILNKWLSVIQQPENATPPWLLPVVGMLDVPIVGNQFHYPAIREICFICFGIGVLLAIIFITIIMSRLLFQASLPVALQPTLLVLALPFAIIFSDYEGFTNTQDMFGSAVYYMGLFFLLVFGGKIFLLPRCCPFRVSWWAVSFPLAAITISSFKYAAYKKDVIFQVIPAVLLIILSITLGYLLFQTFHRILSNRFLLDKKESEKSTRTIQPLS